ncbi:unnamed protein product, partial [Closterium sp. NIES-53]
AGGLRGLCLHSDRGGEFDSTGQLAFCGAHEIVQSYTLPALPQQNGVAERCIGLVMEVARSSMCHASAPQFLWPHAIRYAVHQLNMRPSDARPRVMLVFLWTGSRDVAVDFRVWVSLAHVRTPGANKLSARTHPCVLLGFPLDAFGWVFYYLRRVGLSGGAGGVGVEASPVEGTAASSRRPRPASPPGFPSVSQFPPRLSQRSATAEPGGVRAGGTGGTKGVVGGGSGFGGGGAVGAGTPEPTSRTVRLQTRAQRLLRLEREEQELLARMEEEPHPHRDVSPEPRKSRYRADRPFHLALWPRVPPRSSLPLPPASSLPVPPDPVSNALRAARPVVARVLSSSVALVTFPSLSVAALVATVDAFALSHRLDYVAHFVGGPARSPITGGAPVFPLEVLEDRQFELKFLAGAVPHLCAMLLAPERGLDTLDIPTPCTHAEVVAGPYAPYWIAAKEAEMASYRSTCTFVDAIPPPRANVVSGRWRYKVKRLPGSPPVFKVRYVRDYELHSLDFSIALLQGSLHEQIWLRRPPGFTGSFPAGTQWQLRRPVYGLRQAPCKWYNTLCMTLAAFGFFPSSAGPSLFLRRGSIPFFVLVYVSDLIFATLDSTTLAFVKEELPRRHTCTDLGELQRYLGLQITRDMAAHTITLTQSHMVEQTLTQFRFPFSTVQLTPLAVDHGLTAPPLDESFESSGPYPELVGCLIYLMTCTRPDLSFPLSVLACFVAPRRHRPSLMAVPKRVLRYVASTLGMGLVLGEKQPVTLTGFLDSSYADYGQTYRSSQGYCFSLGTGVVSWRSTRASSVTGSSCEAEVYAAVMAAQELCWLSYLLTDLGLPTCITLLPSFIILV